MRKGPHIIHREKEYYSWYRENTEGKKVDRKRFCKIIATMNLIIQEMLLEGHIVTLPGRAGELIISGHKLEPGYRGDGFINLSIDWKASNEYKEKTGVYKYIYHLNHHNQGIVYKVRWRRSKYDKRHLVNSGMYSFFPCRDLKRAIARKVKEENKEYQEHVGIRRYRQNTFNHRQGAGGS